MNKYFGLFGLIVVSLVGCNSGGINKTIDTVSSHTKLNNAEQRVVLASSFAACDGISDDRDNLANALKEAKNSAFELVIDCPLKINIGMDIAKPLFIESYTTISFTDQGLIIIDNVLVPGFVIANSSGINLINWHIKYIGQTPIDINTGGYYLDEQWYSATFRAPSTGMFTAITLKNWLIENRQMSFGRGVNPFWTGFLDLEAIFYINGDSADIKFSNFMVTNSDVSKFWQYIPIVFSLVPGESTGSSNLVQMPLKSPALVVPHDIEFDDITIDGYLFGWHGSGNNIVFNDINGKHYSDMQDESGRNIGGVDYWFPPPHLFYLNTQPNWDKSLRNYNIVISNVIDNGERRGNIWDYNANNPINLSGGVRGAATSLKMQGDNSRVFNYFSSRLEGLGDILSSEQLVLNNIIAKFDSSYVKYYFPALRFTESGNVGITLNNISLFDTAKVTNLVPITAYKSPNNRGIKFESVDLYMNYWSEASPPVVESVVSDLFNFGGVNNYFNVDANYKNENSFGYTNNSYDSFNPFYPLDIDNESGLSYNNSLAKIKIGSFGLRTYRITNITESDITNISFPEADKLPSGVSYDAYRTSCKLDGSLVLKSKQYCKLTFKYLPQSATEGFFNFNISGNNESVVQRSSYIYVRYSSRIN